MHRLRSGCAVAVLALATLGASAGQIEAEAPTAATPWTSLAANNDDDANFHFLLVSDRTGGARPGVFASAIPKANALQPAFVASLGDLIEGYTEDQAQIDREWDEFEGFVDGLEVPFFYVAGNHDMNNAVMAATWQARFGPSYYRFVYKDVLFLVLNSELFGMVADPATPVPGPWRQEEQLAFIAETLAAHPNPRWTIVLIHQPLWDFPDGVRGDWPQVEAMLETRDYTVFAGHFHRYVKHVRQGRKYITLATTGGGSSLRGQPYGEFDHVGWVTMTANGPRLANLMRDGIHDENIVTAASRAAVRTMASAVRSLGFPPDAPPAQDFQTGSAAFEIANNGGSELRVAYHVAPGPGQRFTGQAEPFALAPGEKRQLAIALATDEPIPYAALRAGRVAWRMQTETSAGPVSLPTTSALLPVAPLPLPSGAKPEVDGALDEWPTLPFAVERQGDIATPATAPTDIAFAFGLRQTDGDVYFAAKVLDDDVYASPEWEDVRDGLEIIVDARPEPRRSENIGEYAATRRGDFADLAVVLAQPEPAPAPTFLPRARWQTRRTPTGYTVEAIVSGEFLDEVAGGRWRHLRIGLAAEDWDEAELANRIPARIQGSSGVYLHWQPDRFGQAPVAASGTFARAE